MARRKLNKNVVVGVSLAAFGTMFVLSVLMLGELQKSDPQHFVDFAQRYEAEGDWKQAALFYQRAFNRSQDAIHLVSIGRMLLNEGDVGGALQAWRQALVNRPDLVEAHMRHLELLLELARLYGRVPEWLEVQRAAEAVSDTEGEKTVTETAAAHHALGLALLNLSGQDPQNTERGLVELRQAVELAPDSVDYAVDLAQRLLAIGQVEEGARLFRQLSEVHPDPGAEGSAVRLAYARFLAGQGRAEEATAAFKNALALAEGEPSALSEARVGYATFLAERWAQAARGETQQEGPSDAIFREAEATLREEVDAGSMAFEPYLQLALLYKAAGRHEDALEACARRLERGLERKGVEAPRNRFHAFQLMLTASEACVALAAAHPDEAGAREEHLARAQRYVDEAGGELPRHPRLFTQSGQIRMARGEDRAALEALRKADEAYRSLDVIDWRTKLDLARLHLQLNEPGAARAVLEEVADRATTAAFWNLYAMALFQTDELDRAMTLADQVLQVDAGNVDAKRIKAAIFERRGLSDRAARLAESPAVRAMLEARDRLMDNDREAAVALLLEAARGDPADPRLIRVTVGELLALDRPGEARALVQAALAVKPEDPFFKKLQVLAQPEWSAEQRDAALLEIIEEELDGYQRAWDLADFHARHNDLPQVLEALREAEAHLLARDTPLAQSATTAQHRGILQVKLRTAAELKDQEAMDEARASAVEHNVDGAGGQFIIGLVHFYRDEVDLAINAFRAALEAQPTNPRTMTRLAQCLMRADRSDEARLYLEQAVRINPQEHEAHRALGLLAKQRGDLEAYREHLVACERLIPNDPWVRQEVIARQEEADPQAAIARREALLRENPDDPANLVRLASLCEKSGELAKADAHYERLLELRPADRNLIVGVAQFFRRTSRPDRALALLASYAETRPTVEERAEAYILIVAHHLGLDDLETAEKTLLGAADLATTTEVAYALGEFYLRTLDRPADAIPWFDKAAEAGRGDKSPRLPSVLAARIACALHRGVDDIELARRYVDELVSAFPEDPQGSFWRSEVFAREGHIDRAIGALSEYLAENPDRPYPLFQRAQHYLAQGRTAQTIEDLETIKRIDPRALELKPRLLLAQLLEQGGRVDAAIHELELLSADAPDAPATHEALVHAYLRAGRFDDADRLITAQINRTADAPEARWFRLRGQVSLGLGDLDKALADFQQAATLEGYAVAGVMGVLQVFLQAGRHAEGLAWYEQFVASDPGHPALAARAARLMAGQGRTEEAVRALRTSMARAMDASVGEVGAVTSELQALYGADAAAAERAIELFSDNRLEAGLARANERILVRLQRLAGRPADAADTLKRLNDTARSDQERSALLIEQAEMFQAAGDPERARAACAKALEGDSDNWIALNNLAYLLAEELGRYNEALPYAKRAVALADVFQTLDTLGWTYVGVGEHALAVAELSRAIRLDPNAALSYYHLGEAYRRSGQPEEARRILTQGRALADRAGRAALLEQIDTSLEAVGRGERTPPTRGAEDSRAAGAKPAPSGGQP